MRVPIVGLTASLGLALAAPGALAAKSIPAAGPTSAHAAGAAPDCEPTTLNTSATLAGAVTVSPLPGSRDASPQTQISFLGTPKGDLSRISVVGSRTGAHPGRFEGYSDGDGASFLPSKPFAEGETVTVSAQVRNGGAVQPLSDSFTIAYEDPLSTTPEPVHAGNPSEIQYFRSRPDLRPPTVTVTASSPATAPGEIFTAPYDGPGQSGPMILDPDGGLIWFKALPKYTSATNLRVQEYAGKPVLTWWQGDISVHGFGQGEDVILDDAYAEIAHVRAQNGLQADLHEFQLTPQGTALITAYEPIRCDLASVGGSADGAVTDGTFQEIDVRTGLVMFQWTSLDHVALAESYAPASVSDTAFPFDYFHINSINLDQDGSLLISSRNTWTAYDLNPQTGQIEWQLGGKHSSFTMGTGTRTAWQHDPRELANGSFSIFDNGATPTVHSQSRGIVVGLEPQTKTATLVSEFTHTPPISAKSQGNVQALPNGDWFLGWGEVPDLSELSPTGALLFDAHFPTGDQSYRDLRFAWTGLPATRPVFTLDAAHGAAAARGAGTVYASWNGATEVASWRVLAGAGAHSLKPVAAAQRSGFETAIALRAGTAGRYLTVQALGANGQVLGVAATVAATGL
ncbi:MAG TPA: arylsulfotransferase family protein [Solirubrobacteraceae bacterium]